MVKKVSLSVQILLLLLEDKEKTYTIREISHLLKKDYKNTYDTLQKLKDSLHFDKKGNATHVSFKPKLTFETFNAEMLRKQYSATELPLLLKDLNGLSNPLFIAILFGSYAKKKATKHSDIDLCIICSKEEVKTIEQKLAIHPRLELQFFTPAEFFRMIDSKTFNVAHEIVRCGIVLKNIESYYSLIDNGSWKNS